MTNDELTIIGIFILGIGALIGIFKTKTAGFGKYTTSLILLTLVLIVASLFFATGKIESSTYTNIIFSVAGFAGGLITGKES